MNTQTLKENETNLVGGWTSYHELTEKDLAIWKETKLPLGVNYKPIMVKTQIVNGVNYKFKCSASIPPAEIIWEAVVEIHKPTNGAPYVVGIVRI